MEKDDFLLNNHFKCVQCNKCVKSPIRSCENGHLACDPGSCQNTNTGVLFLCKKCNSLLDDPSPDLKALVERLEFQCTTGEVCIERSKLDSYDSHAEKCPLRDIKCVVPLKNVCKSEVRWTQYTDHLKCSHGATESMANIEGWSNPLRILLDTSKSWQVEIILFSGITFVLNTIIEEDAVYFWIAALLPEVECQANNFNARFHILKDGPTGVPGSERARMFVTDVHKTFQQVQFTEFSRYFFMKDLLQSSREAAYEGAVREVYIKLNFCPE